jgi:hypothetical protein
MNEQPRHPTGELEKEIAREASIAYIPPRPTAQANTNAEAKTFANHADDLAHGIAALLLSMDQAEKSLAGIEASASAMLDKAKPARKLIEAVRASTQK